MARKKQAHEMRRVAVRIHRHTVIQVTTAKDPNEHVDYLASPTAEAHPHWLVDDEASHDTEQSSSTR